MSAPRVAVLLPTHDSPATLGPSTEAVTAAIDDPRLRWLPCPKALGVGFANRNVAPR